MALMPTARVIRSAKEQLIDWANAQDSWVRAIVGEALLSRRELSEAAIERITASYLAEKQLSDGEAIDAPPLGDAVEAEEATQVLRLIALSGCSSVNALADDQIIEFSPRMTLVFGENATGKTGYVRVLKRVANVRSAEEIIPDIHRATPPPALQAALRYSLDAEERELAWAGDVGVSPLTRISVFDAPAVALHLEDNLTYVYTPPDLAVFRYVHTAIENVRSRLEAERAEREPKGNPFLSAFARDATVYPKIEQLGATTNLGELEELADVSEAERGEVETLKANIEALGAQASGGHAQMLRSRVAVIKALEVIAAAAGAFERDELTAAIAEVRDAREAQDTAAAAVFGGGDLPATVRPAWQQFVEAGDQYVQAAGLDGYPQQGDPCIYCRQPLPDAAVTLLGSYREYVSGAAASAVASAAEKLRLAQRPLNEAAVGNALSTIEATLPVIEDSSPVPPWAAPARELIESVTAAREQLAGQGDAGLRAVPDVVTPGGLRALLATALQDAESTLAGLEGDAKKRQDLLTEKRAELATLEARLTLERLLPEIRAQVEGTIWATRLKTLLGRFQGLLRSLTEVSKTASDELLNQSFQRAFEDECRALRAPTVTLGFPGRRGQAARRKTVAADHTISEVLSEGEQKVIAVADFLAEAAFRSGSSPVVFDDPVTSLDHRRIDEMVGRIVKLSETHQVVVFTHNILFVAKMLEHFEHSQSECAFYQVSERPGGAKGFVSGGAHPRIDTPAKIRGRVNAGIQDVKAASEADRTAKVEATYDHLRAWCEAVVETELLGDVTKRYRANVAIQNLDRIKTDRLAAAFTAITPIWERACRYMPGHSQPMETLGIRPTIEELEQDWQALQDAQREYKSG
ncbi:MAG: AAA family ATPase [Solirubrobacteraceae bacterium]